MSTIQLLTTFSGFNFNWTEYQMGESNNFSAVYDGNIIVPINFPIPTTFEIFFDRKVESHTGTLGYYVDGQLNTNALWSGIGNFKVKTININSWSGINNIQFRSVINDPDEQSSSSSEWKVYANGVLVYYHSYDNKT